MDWRELQSNASGIDLSKIKPLHDFILAKPFTMEEQLAMEARLIAPSPIHMTGDGRYRSDRPRGNRYGKVIAIGDGDILIGYFCQKCPGMFARLATAGTRCRVCDLHMTPLYDVIKDGTWTSRAEMHVSPGDVVVFPKSPANEFIIDGEEYCWLHEEQHVLAVIEQEAA